MHLVTRRVSEEKTGLARPASLTLRVTKCSVSPAFLHLHVSNNRGGEPFFVNEIGRLILRTLYEMNDGRATIGLKQLVRGTVLERINH